MKTDLTYIYWALQQYKKIKCSRFDLESDDEISSYDYLFGQAITGPRFELFGKRLYLTMKSPFIRT